LRLKDKNKFSKEAHSFLDENFTLRLGVKPPFLRPASWIAEVVTQMKPFLPRIIDTPHGKLTK